MTYFTKITFDNNNYSVEYAYSSVSECIKIVEMHVNGKFHRTNWMPKDSVATLMSKLESDFTDRACKTGRYAQ